MFSKIIAGVMNWGVWGKNLSKSQMKDNILFCIENGITSFDHADIYGGYTTEASFGNAFKKSGVKREAIQLISKCGICYSTDNTDNYTSFKINYKLKHYNYSKDYIIASAEQSLANLKTDYLDILLLHRPSPLMNFDEIKDALNILKTQGKIKSYGVSNFSASQMALAESRFTISANQLEFSLTQHQALFDNSLDYLQQKNITSMAWSPLGSYFGVDNEQNNRIKMVLHKFSLKYNATADQLLLAWILKHPNNIHPVVGTTNQDRFKKSIEALKINLETEDWFELLVASQGHDVP